MFRPQPLPKAAGENVGVLLRVSNVKKSNVVLAAGQPPPHTARIRSAAILSKDEGGRRSLKGYRPQFYRAY